MRLGLVGLGRMGGDMAGRLLEDGHEIVGHDLSEENVRAAAREGASPADSLEDLASELAPPRAAWTMVPHGDPTRATIERLRELFSEGDLIVDGGNSQYEESRAHAEACAERGILFLDVGVSGGVWGREEGYCLMVGGPEEGFDRLEPALRSLAPEDGYAHVGPAGAGHFVKMIHNAIEYAMLQALGEGFECLERSGDYEIDLEQVASLWQHGSVVRSWLMELLGKAFREEGDDLERIAAHVDDSGTGRWTVEYALKNAVPVPAISQALYERFDSRVEERFSHQVIAALREQFGGHATRER